LARPRRGLPDKMPGLGKFREIAKLWHPGLDVEIAVGGDDGDDDDDGSSDVATSQLVIIRSVGERSDVIEPCEG